MKTVKKVLFCGYYGEQNAGDDAFNAVSVWGAQKYWHADEFTLLSRTVPKLPFCVKPLFPAESRKFKAEKFLVAIKEMWKYNAIVYAGGSILQSSLDLLSFRLYSKIMAQLGMTKLNGIGVSLGPFESDSDYRSIKNFVNTFGFLGLRDRKSFEIAGGMRLKNKFQHTFDLAVLMPELAGAVARGGDIGVSLCRYESLSDSADGTEKLRFDRIRKTLSILARETGRKIILFVFNTSYIGDVAISGDMRRALIQENVQSEVLVYDGDPIGFYQRVAGCAFMLGVRLHSAIFAYSAGIPFMLVEYHRKCTDFLDDIGYPHAMRAPAGFKPPEQAAAEIRQLMDAGSIEKIVVLPPAQAREKAKLNFTEAVWE
jgi:polysaccharide pyruvyl transferase WcaK-like protein